MVEREDKSHGLVAAKAAVCKGNRSRQVYGLSLVPLSRRVDWMIVEVVAYVYPFPLARKPLRKQLITKKNRQLLFIDLLEIKCGRYICSGSKFLCSQSLAHHVPLPLPMYGSLPYICIWS
jgi:hypothetical protein